MLHRHRVLRLVDIDLLVIGSARQKVVLGFLESTDKCEALVYFDPILYYETIQPFTSSKACAYISKPHEMLFLKPIEPYSDSMKCNIVLETNRRSYPASLRLGLHGIWVGRASQCGV